MRLSLRGSKNWASTPARNIPTPKPISKTEFRRLCTKLAINDNETAAELFGISWRTAQRYWYGESAVPEPLARLLRAAIRHRWGHDDLRQLAL